MGLHSIASHDAGACIVRFSTDGKVLDFVAISEERLLRKKYPYTFPIHSIEYCMNFYGLTELSQIDLIVSDYFRINRWFNTGPAYNVKEYDYLKIKFDYDPKNIITIDHHLAHAASVYYTSNFDESAILIVDGNGSDLQTTSFLIGNKDKINLIDTYKAQGIGAVYTAVTGWVLGLGTGGEGKTMGLAPYGEKFKPVLNIDGNLDGIKNDFSEFIYRLPNSDVLNQLDEKNRINPIKQSLKPCTDKKNLINEYYSRIAFDVQQETERVMIHLGKEIYKKTNSKNICLAGGVALNSVANKKMFDAHDFENIFVFPACSDSGLPFGLAIWAYYNYEKFNNFPKRRLEFKNAYTGKSYSNEYIQDIFKKFSIEYKKTSTKEVAELLASGKIIGWFQGGSEYGPRALGHRSILTDSRKKEMKDILNLKVKHRESFRPFAPAILQEKCSEYFDMNDKSPYMLLVATVKKPEIIPAITHVDGTARVQTVTKEENGIFYDLVTDFYKITDVPVILNTSFNDTGEPIVETPEDAIICFLNTEMDYLVLNDFILDASMINKENILKELRKERELKIKTDRDDILEKKFPGYNDEECDIFLKESNKISEWHVKYRSKYELEKKILEWKSKTRILIIGTKDHTKALQEHVNNFWNLNIVGFIDYKKFDKNQTDDLEYPNWNWKNLDDDYDEIFISSYEYMYEILEKIREMNVKKPVYAMYDNSSRNLMDILESFPKFFKTSFN